VHPWPFGHTAVVYLLQIPTASVAIEPRVPEIAGVIPIADMLLLVVRTSEWPAASRWATEVDLLQVPAIAVAIKESVVDCAVGAHIDEMLLCIRNVHNRDWIFVTT
jgi:hypothetical protein